MPLFSIITVCLNDLTGLRKTAASVKQQDFQDYEWIVIDGESSDGTVDFLRKEKQADHLISEKDEGIYDAMNKGIRCASGRYLLFLNAGDHLASAFVLKNVAEFVKNSDADLLIGSIKVEYTDHVADRITCYGSKDLRKKNIYHKTLPHSGTFIHHELFKGYGNYDDSFRIAGDYDFFVRVLLAGASYDFVPDCISVFQMDGVSTQMKGTEVLLSELEIIRKRHYSLPYRLLRKGLYGTKKIIKSSIATIRKPGR